MSKIIFMLGLGIVNIIVFTLLDISNGQETNTIVIVGLAVINSTTVMILIELWSIKELLSKKNY